MFLYEKIDRTGVIVDQQKQTKDFFKNHADTWQLKASDEVYSVITDRHRAAHRTLAKYPRGSGLLDVGCGTGQLAIEADSNGFQAVGVDFAEEMIEVAKRNAREAGSSAQFQSASIFDYRPQNSYHVISAMGFIEYISLEQLDDFLAFCFNNTTNEGSVSIGSRNRLFNLTTFNEYTDLEKNLGTINELFEEASICTNSNSLEEFIQNLREFSGLSDLVQNHTHPLTGIEVGTRYQFTPSDLMLKVERHGFTVTNIYPVNYHSFHPKLDEAILNAENILSWRKKIAELVSLDGLNDFRFIPNSSSFVLEASKTA